MDCVPAHTRDFKDDWALLLAARYFVVPDDPPVSSAAKHVLQGMITDRTQRLSADQLRAPNSRTLWPFGLYCVTGSAGELWTPWLRGGAPLLVLLVLVVALLLRGALPLLVLLVLTETAGAHNFFSGLDFARLREMRAPIQPTVTGTRENARHPRQSLKRSAAHEHSFTRSD